MSMHRCRGWIRFATMVAVLSAALVPAQAQQSAAPLSQPQLEQLVAPIALHPDPLLSQMLMASTYPTEVIQAARWVSANPGVSGAALQEAMQKQPWDPSVKALTAVPQVLQMMSDKLDWTQQLGDAFLGQQAELLAAVQRLRQRAEAAGHLKSSEQQRVSNVEAPAPTRAPSGGTPPPAATTPRIAIEPANPDTFYVPVYDPRVVYGDWPYPDYEPYYWYPAGFTGYGILSFATAVAVGSAIWGRFDWWHDRVGINVNRFNQFNRTNIVDNTWRHNPRHRGNVPYRDAKVAQRFGDAGRAAARDAYRGKAEARRGDLAKGAAGAAGAAAAVAAGKAAAAGRAKAANAAGTGKAKAATARHAKGAGNAQTAAARGKHAAPTKAARTGAGNRARTQHASRPKATAHRPQMRGYGPARGAGHRPAFRSGGGGHRVGMRGGGGFRGGGGRRGRR